jgi:hypothetical protein
MDYNSPLIMHELSRLKQEDIKRDFQRAQYETTAFRDWQAQLTQTISTWFASQRNKQTSPRKSKLSKQ